MEHELWTKYLRIAIYGDTSQASWLLQPDRPVTSQEEDLGTLRNGLFRFRCVLSETP